LYFFAHGVFNKYIMANELYKFVASGIKFDWNFNDIADRLGPDLYQGNDIPKFMYDVSDRAYFQTFFSKVSTSTNFWKQFKEQSIDVCDKVIAIQSIVTESIKNGEIERSYLTDALLEKTMRLEDVLFLRMAGNYGADPHCDVRRALALNIGFQNSNMCTTYIKEGKDTEAFYDDMSSLQAFTMNDGDACLINVGHVHSVRSTFPESIDQKRYLISVNLSKKMV
jgi:hypothetical protein